RRPRPELLRLPRPLHDQPEHVHPARGHGGLHGLRHLAGQDGGELRGRLLLRHHPEPGRHHGLLREHAWEHQHVHLVLGLFGADRRRARRQRLGRGLHLPRDEVCGLQLMSLAPPEPSQLAPGYKLDRYELICPIAEGGMASVWIGRQTGKHGFQKLVAIKTILPKFAADPRFEQMFVDEARIASRIEHANVTQILDVGEQHDVTYLVMEYIDGDALSKLNRAAKKKGGAIPPGVVLRVMADVCGGLHAAHELLGADGQTMGVVHRDVSPQNVLVSTKGVAKLIDFGIAKARDRLAGDTKAPTLKGKVQYMAPEQALGRPVDRRADVWAVGAVLYHLLSGKPPFEAENEIQTLFVLSSGRPPPPMRSAHPAVAAVVRRALSHVREQRFATAAEMQQALE